MLESQHSGGRGRRIGSSSLPGIHRNPGSEKDKDEEEAEEKKGRRKRRRGWQTKSTRYKYTEYLIQALFIALANKSPNGGWGEREQKWSPCLVIQNTQMANKNFLQNSLQIIEIKA